MSRNSRISNAKAQKLRSGHTYWRCQIQADGTVYISEEFLSGSKFTVALRSMFPEDIPENKRKVLYTSLVIGAVDPKEWTRRSYLRSVNPGSSINTFSTRRAAQRWKREVEAGLHPDAVVEAMDHWEFCDSMNRMHDDMYYSFDSFDDYEGPDNFDDYRPATLEGGRTLGELPREKLAQQEAEANDDKFALEG